jgi:flavodoxin
MKTVLPLILSIVFLLAFAHQALAQDASRILVAYFSWSENAKALAEQVAAETGGVLFEIKTVTPYPDNYDECLEVAKKEHNENARPALAEKVPNIGDYNVIFLAFPNWMGTLPMGVFTFLESYDLSGKTIYPLVTHGGGGFGSSLNDLKRLSPKAMVGDAVEIRAHDGDPKNPPTVKTPDSKVSAWLSKLNLNP